MSRSFSSAKSSYRKVSHIIFDMDGLLLDTEGVYKRAIGDIASSFGKVYTPEIRKKLLGTQEHDTSKIAVKELQLPINWEQFLELFKQKARSNLMHCPILPGVEKFVKHLHSHKVPIAVATSSSRESYELKIKDHLDFFSMFHHTVTGGSDPEVKQGKPSPDIFLVCASRFPDKPKPENCLVFEDAPNGVAGAIAAGMQCVMVPDKEMSTENCDNATLVLNSMEEFKPELFGLPAMK